MRAGVCLHTVFDEALRSMSLRSDRRLSTLTSDTPEPPKCFSGACVEGAPVSDWAAGDFFASQRSESVKASTPVSVTRRVCSCQTQVCPHSQSTQTKPSKDGPFLLLKVSLRSRIGRSDPRPASPQSSHRSSNARRRCLLSKWVLKQRKRGTATFARQLSATTTPRETHRPPSAAYTGRGCATCGSHSPIVKVCPTRKTSFASFAAQTDHRRPTGFLKPLVRAERELPFR